MGYQACGLKGTVYIGAEENPGAGYCEKLTHISDGDEAVFRYVKSEEEYNSIWILSEGSGLIEVLLGGKTAGFVTVTDGVQQNSEIKMAAGEYELTLRFRNTKGLQIKEIVIN